MNALEAELHYPYADTLPEAGRKLAVAPGIWWIRKPLPFALDHINLWLLRDCFDGRDGWTVIDCGIASETTQQLWRQVIANELEGLPIVRILCTHTHPDHVGNAAWLQQQMATQLPAHALPPLWMTLGEYAMGRVLQAALPGTDGPATVAHYREHGLVDEAALASLSGRTGYFKAMVPDMPSTFRRIVEGEEIHIGQEVWRVVTGFGHSPEHASLYGERGGVLISGDMLLPRISTNVSVHAIEPEASPVQQFMESLERFAPLPADTLVLPSHGKPFMRMHRRIEQLRAHHDARLEEVLAHCLVPRTAAEIVPVMFRRPLDHHQLFFAFGEALAHLHALWYQGLVSRRRGADGVYRFEQS
jgi:glyoxylase-like metal-dependent hydrolase (beta-lactamase superfamily II)